MTVALFIEGDTEYILLHGLNGGRERQTVGELYKRRGPGAGLSMAWMPLTSQMPLRATSKDSGLVPESLKMGAQVRVDPVPLSDP